MLLKVRSQWEWSADHTRDVPSSQGLAHKSARRVTWGVCETTLVPSAELGRNAMTAASGRTVSRGVSTPGIKAGPPLREAEHSTPDCWIADTGCGHDLLAAKWVSECDKNKLLSSGSPLLFSGVGGEKPADMILRVKSPALKTHVVPYVLDATPDVLSIGRRCVEEGWSFWWPEAEPVPDGRTPLGPSLWCTKSFHAPDLTGPYDMLVQAQAFHVPLAEATPSAEPTPCPSCDTCGTAHVRARCPVCGISFCASCLRQGRLCACRLVPPAVFGVAGNAAAETSASRTRLTGPD